MSKMLQLEQSKTHAHPCEYEQGTAAETMRNTHTHLRCSTCEGDVKGGGHALVRPARKVHQFHAEAAAEPHDVGRP